MTNYKLRFSGMIPSKWFHKLKNMTKLRKMQFPPYSLNTTKNKEPFSESKSKSLPHSSNSYFSNRSHTSLEAKVLQISPRNSLYMAQSKRKSVYKPSPPSSSSVSTGFNKNKIKFLPSQDNPAHSSNLKLNSTDKACPTSKLTKESRKTRHLSVKVNNKEKVEEEDACRIKKKRQSGRRSSSVNTPRIKLRVSSPRIQVSSRRSRSRPQSRQVVESFAVIKSSLDPKKDFRESMVEMITENNIRAYKDLEDLLACYLSLNPKEYHDLIIEVFVKVWFEVINCTLNNV